MTRPVLITGSSSGIGLLTAEYLATRGVTVYATVRTPEDAARLGAIDNVEAFVCDVTDDDQVAALRSAVDERGDGLYGIVHNAGIAHLGHLTSTTLADIKQVFEVNVFGVHRVTNAFVDLILGAKGRIVTMSSISGTRSSALVGAYSMSKHALEAYTDALAAQLGPEGVHVAAIAPGNYASAIAKNAAERFEVPSDAPPELKELFENASELSRSQFPPPEDVAEACFAALFDDAPADRYLVVPIAEEADRTLAQAADEWSRLNASTPFAWTTERLLAHLGGDGTDQCRSIDGRDGCAACGPRADALRTLRTGCRPSPSHRSSPRSSCRPSDGHSVPRDTARRPHRFRTPRYTSDVRGCPRAVPAFLGYASFV